MNRIYKNINGIWGILLLIYTLCVIYLESFADDFYLSSFGKLILPLAVILFFNYVIPKIKKLELEIDSDYSKKSKTKFFLIFFLISFVWLGINFAAACPGGYSYDSITQYKQVISGDYSDWHPVLQTLITFKLPLLLFKNVSAIVLCQIIEFSLAAAYAAVTMLNYSKKKLFVYLSYAFIVFNPAIALHMMYPWKDCTFAIAALMCVCFGIHIYATSGQWLKKSTNAAAFAAMLCVAQYSRHNAILFTIPFLIAGLIVSGALKKTWKSKIKLVSLFAVFCILVSGVLYPMIDVEKPGNRQSEMTGLPMSIIANVVQETPDKLDDETKEFVYSVISEEDCKKYNAEYGWNSVKFSYVDVKPIDDINPIKLLKITAKCIAASPKAAVDAVIKLTDMVWQLSYKDCTWSMTSTSVSENDVGIQYCGIKLLNTAQMYLNKLFESTCLAYPCWCLGFQMLLLLIFMVAKFSELRDFKKLILCFPMFIYNFGSMLLLSGQTFRIFLYSFCITPLLIFVLLLKKNSNSDITFEKMSAASISGGKHLFFQQEP